MGAGHSHTVDLNQVSVGTRARNILVGFLALVGVLTLAGLIWLWPSPNQLASLETPYLDNPNVTTERGTVVEVVLGCATPQASSRPCYTASVEVTTGADAGQVVSVELMGASASAGLQPGDTITLGRNATGTDVGTLWNYISADRLPVLIWLTVLFVVVVVAVARWKGLLALLGLGVSGFVLMGFMLPALILGKPGMIVALVGGTAIMFVVLYVAHGVSWRTSTALAGTLLGLAVTTLLGMASVGVARLSGFADENEFELASIAPGLNFQELLMVGIIVGGLGVLNDVTITQSSAVWELRAAAPSMSRGKLFAAGMRIGRDHIASSIYTIVFAYAGSTLAVLLLLFFTNREALDLLNEEMFAGEIVRTIGSAIGLILSVPITTGIAALTVAAAESSIPAAHEHDAEAMNMDNS